MRVLILLSAIGRGEQHTVCVRKLKVEVRSSAATRVFSLKTKSICNAVIHAAKSIEDRSTAKTASVVG